MNLFTKGTHTLCTLAFAELQLERRLQPTFGILLVQFECALESRYLAEVGAQPGPTSPLHHRFYSH